MRVKRLIKSFEFLEENRDLIELDSNVRLNPQENRVQLEDDGGTYSSSGVVKSWVANPSTVKQWLGFDAMIYNPKDYLGEEITSFAFRIGDGTDQYFWNGSSWVVDIVHWNTEAEVASNISSFSVAEKKIQIIIQLSTSDSEYTPYLYEIKILWASNVEFQEDLIVRSLMPMFRDQIRPISDFPAKLLATTAVVDMTSSSVSASFPLKTPYNLTSIDSVFNHTDDPEHQTDLLLSFVLATKVITLSEAVDSGKVLWIKFLWEPEVALTTGQEYDEVDKVPAIYIEDVNGINQRTTSHYDSVRNKATGTAVKISAPCQRDLDIELRLVTAKQSDLQKLADEVRRFFDNNVQLRSVGLDEKYYFFQTSDFDSRNTANQKEIFGGNFGCRIVSALFYTKQEEDLYIIQNLNLQFSKRP